MPVSEVGKPIEQGERNCITCGRPHALYQSRTSTRVSWADPFDGHAYEPESWETVARRLQAELDARE